MKRRMSFKSKDDPMLIQSLSDDQLYRGKRRASIPNNFSITQKESLKDVGTSNGKPILRRKIIEFEGDGPLGIIFKDKDKMMCVKSIMKGSVASEYSELNEGMIVSQINDVNCLELGYFKSMECLGKLWRDKSCVTLHFKYEDVNDIINTPVNNPIYKFLEDSDCEDFYDCFVELGATELDDLQFIEYDDLVKMNMPLLKRRKLQVLLSEDKSKDKSKGKSQLKVYFNPTLTEKEKAEEGVRLTKLHSHKFFIEVIETDNFVANDV